ncbi:BZ3500_MvSof-1268-A1-R1_Chr3-1g05692 [Microbotryum saponariae]|uniref:BZ3500_MvSof-1268-A1-R1_Chr3-1g05692 protein n=1 Tax=Microbotryum saponariae TaxID=289078 RepID=A0A2X0L0G9_9BASI|nr:BZ3500_MvSof-1268-A1-R1_Chr3-1g05692 [Microbotryum saponariae]SDA04882.1 BZ3501_MvSof-1269-A2-R1_Chr3-1g05362 [Microbotryum saponariae]
MRGPLLLSVLCASFASSLLVGAAPAPLSPRDSTAGHRLAVRGPGDDDATTRRTSSVRGRVVETTERVRAEATTRARTTTTAARVATTTPAREALRTTTSAAAVVAAVRTTANIRASSGFITSSSSDVRGRTTVTTTNARAASASARPSSAGVFSDANGFLNSSSKAFPWVILAIVSVALLVIIGSFYLIKRRCYKGRLEEMDERGDSDTHSNCSQFTYYAASSTNLHRSDTVKSHISSTGSEILDSYEDEKHFDEDKQPFGSLQVRSESKAAYLGWDTLPPSAAKPPCALYAQPRRASCYAEPARPETTLQLSTRELQEQARRSSNSLILPPVATNNDGIRSANRSSTTPPSYRSASAPSMIQSQRVASPNPHPLLMLRNTNSSSTLVEPRSVDPNARLFDLPPVPRPYQPSVGSSLKYALSDDSHTSNSDAYAV